MKKRSCVQVVRVDTLGRTVLSRAPAERADSATRPLGGVTAPPVGWDSPANKVTLKWRLSQGASCR